MGDPKPANPKRVTDAMLEMRKTIVANLLKAWNGNF
jgi:hypothetical protein